MISDQPAMPSFGIRRNRGFTLLEILVALAIVAISLSALSSSTNTLNRNNVSIRDKTIAQWVAEDVLTGYRISGQWPSVGLHEDSRELANTDWNWQLEIEQTNTQDMYRATVTVRLADQLDRNIYRLSTFYSSQLRAQEIPLEVN